MKGKLTILLFLTVLTGYCQQVISTISSDISQEEIETHVRFLASDALMGREAGTAEIDIAAAYIASYFEALGVKKLPGMDHYLHNVPLYKIATSKEGTIQIGGSELRAGNQMATDYPNAANINAPVIFINYGTASDFKPDDVKGKIVVYLAGSADGDFRSALTSGLPDQKRKALQDAGAKAAIILWHYDALPWNRLQGYLQRDAMTEVKPEEGKLPYFYIDASNDQFLNKIKNNLKGNVEINYPGSTIEELNSYNVLGYIEGTDDSAKEDYVMLSAHYDHLGGQVSDSGKDMIFNGARDNAVGTAAVMMAADYFSDHKPKHSVLFALWTAEEKGLIGSRYFAENPPVPLKDIIFNLNIDGAGYNDTTIVTVIGLNRTKAGKAISEAASAFELNAVPDPAPEQNLFDRSDNVNFARAGIPSPTFSLGFTAFDEEIAKYYHNAADEAETVNFSYITKYTRAYTLAAHKIANRETETFWKSGDKYEGAGQELYSK